jgi:hypothetical protein
LELSKSTAEVPGVEVFTVEASRAEGLATGVLLAGGDSGGTNFGVTTLGTVVTSVVIIPATMDMEDVT